MSGKVSGPNVRPVIACDRAENWGGGFSLHRFRHQVARPCTFAELTYYLQVTNGSGSHTFEIQQVSLLDQNPGRIIPLGSLTIDVGADRTAVREARQVFRPVLFWIPDQYEFLLYSGMTRGRYLPGEMWERSGLLPGA
jgi:hypothetical protein